MPAYKAKAEAKGAGARPKRGNPHGQREAAYPQGGDLYTAALLAPAVPALLRERFGGGDYEYTRSDYDGEERAAALNAMADDRAVGGAGSGRCSATACHLRVSNGPARGLTCLGEWSLRGVAASSFCRIRRRFAG